MDNSRIKCLETFWESRVPKWAPGYRLSLKNDGYHDKMCPDVILWMISHFELLTYSLYENAITKM